MERAGDALDRAGVRAFLEGRDEAAFLELYDRHTPALFQFALRVLGGAVRDAEDAVQETWLRAVDRMREFRWESSLRTWLTGFALNCSREILRRRGGATESAGAPVQGERSAGVARRDPAADERIAATLDLERALARLPDDMRLALILHDVHGHTHEEVADMLGISPGTSKSRTSRGRNRLRALLRPGAEKGGDMETGTEQRR